jgi:hypothetical protein
VHTNRYEAEKKQKRQEPDTKTYHREQGQQAPKKAGDQKTVAYGQQGVESLCVIVQLSHLGTQVWPRDILNKVQDTAHGWAFKEGDKMNVIRAEEAWADTLSCVSEAQQLYAYLS